LEENFPKGLRIIYEVEKCGITTERNRKYA